MKKTLLITAMVGLMVWLPLTAEAGKKKGKWHRHHGHHAHWIKDLQQQIVDLQDQIVDLQDQINAIGTGGTGGEPGDLAERIEAIEDYISRSTGFTDMGDGTIRDDITGLIWLKDPVPGGMTLAEAETAMDNLAGGPWRLPEQNELDRLLIYSDRAGSLVISPQFKTIGDGLWTVSVAPSTPFGGGGPIVFDSEKGDFSVVDEGSNSLEFMVLPVME